MGILFSSIRVNPSRFSLFLVLLSILNPIKLPEAQALELLVPAYGNPCCGSGKVMWNGLISTAQSNVPLHVILNPDSGPGAASTIDPSFINVDPLIADPLLDLKRAGALIYGYVPTGFGSRDINNIKLDIDKYYSSAYWFGGDVLISGIFFDEISNDIANVGRYNEIRDYVRSKDSRAIIIGNPGYPTLIDSSNGKSGFTISDYAKVADILVAFENTGEEYRNNYKAPSWASDITVNHLANIIHSETSVAGMLQSLSLAKSRDVGYVYITDATLPNPFSTLPFYWADKVSVLSTEANETKPKTPVAQAVPEPSTWLSLGIAFALGALSSRARQRKLNLKETR